MGAALVLLYGMYGAVVGKDRSARVRSVTCAALAPAAVLASPYALQLPGYYRLMLLDPPFGRLIVKWNRTSLSGNTATFFALAVTTVALSVFRRHRLSAVDHLILWFSLATALWAVRGIVWFALAALALAPSLATPRIGSSSFTGRRADILTAFFLAMAAIALSVTAVRPDKDYGIGYPSAAAEVLARHSSPTSRVFADPHSADWLLWKQPSLRGRIAYDVRFELLRRAEVDRLLIFSLRKEGWMSVVQSYDFVVSDPRHVAGLLRSGGWHRLYADSRQ